MASSLSYPSLASCNIYVDSENVRLALRDRGLGNRFDPSKLKRFVEGQLVGGRPLVVVRIFFYDTLLPHVSEAERETEQRYFERVEQLPDTSVILGRVGGGGKQKGVDVSLAVDALEAALSGQVDAVVIASGDGDYVPVAQAIRRAGPHDG